jgi:hydrogenase/urease accessory protein HupE
LEPWVREYFRRIVLTISFGLLWMALNTAFGIMQGYAFIEKNWQTKNVLYFIGFSINLLLYLWFVFITWRKPLKTEKDYE